MFWLFHRRQFADVFDRCFRPFEFGLVIGDAVIRSHLPEQVQAFNADMGRVFLHQSRGFGSKRVELRLDVFLTRLQQADNFLVGTGV